jgi:hypothetical protein
MCLVGWLAATLGVPGRVVRVVASATAVAVLVVGVPAASYGSPVAAASSDGGSVAAAELPPLVSAPLVPASGPVPVGVFEAPDLSVPAAPVPVDPARGQRSSGFDEATSVVVARDESQHGVPQR